jgi:beta-lactamase superfamily II metal-dependent hydrolase
LAGFIDRAIEHGIMLKMHFFNVGHGECTLIEHHSGRLTMVDINTSHEYDRNTRQEIAADNSRGLGLGGGVSNPLSAAADLGLRGGGISNPLSAAADLGLLGGVAAADAAAKSELTDPIEFLRKNYPGRQLFRFILTHPDLDHMRGLKRLRETVGFANFWDVRHAKETPVFRGDNDREEWRHYQQLRSGAFDLTPKYFTRGDEYFAFARDENGLGNGDCIEILSPSDALVEACNAAEKSNDLSFVLRFRHANRRIMLTGDIEEDAWNDLEAVYKGSLKSDFLQASHHGRDSGFHESSLKLINPLAVIVSVGRKPPTDAHSKYKAICSKIWSTRYYGDLTLVVQDDGTYNWTAARNGGS